MIADQLYSVWKNRKQKGRKKEREKERNTMGKKSKQQTRTQNSSKGKAKDEPIKLTGKAKLNTDILTFFNSRKEEAETSLVGSFLAIVNNHSILALNGKRGKVLKALENALQRPKLSSMHRRVSF